MRFLALLMLAIVLAGHGYAQSMAPVDNKVVLEVSLATKQREFHIGEVIPLQLAFSSTVKDHYQLNAAHYDRSGRMNYEQFKVSPADGAVDPLPTYTGSMGGLTGFIFLTAEPWTIKLSLNEWIRFTRPGEYRLVVLSNRVGVRDPANPFGTSTVTTRSNEITLKIVAADPAWQKQVFGAAVLALNAPTPKKQQDLEQYAISRHQAAETLRFLGSPEAAREMARRMRGEDLANLESIFMLGLISSPHRDVARSALEEGLADPDHPIDATFLYTLRVINSDPAAGNANWREEQKRVLEELIQALPAKRGKALSVSLSTAVNEAWNGEALPKQTTDMLVKQLVSMFDQLPQNEQNQLLDSRWNKIASPAMIPILRKYAQSYRDFPEMRESKAYDSLRLSAAALERWYELDPAGARQAVITEISRPRPRFGARVLGLLPDETLPEVDFALAEHFRASEDFEGSSHLASLIARYATEAILPQIIDKLDRHIGKWACDIQNPILAYVLRVNPALARPRIERAIAARGENFTACNHELFQIISEIHNDPLLEEIAIHSLDDPDLEVAMTAATMLGKFGSPAAEAALWRRYESWRARWTGHESELDLVSADPIDERWAQLSLGENLVQALATGRSWLSDKSKLQRLSEMSSVRRLHQQLLDNYLKSWETEPLTISFNFETLPGGFYARLVQYEFHSLDDLKTKLSQFPSGTKFLLAKPAVDSPANERAFVELRAFLSEHGMSVAGEKSDN